MNKKVLLKDIIYILDRTAELYYKGNYITNLESIDFTDWLEYEVYYIESNYDVMYVYLIG